MNTASDRRTVSIELSEIQRIRDALARVRDDSPRCRELFRQVAGLYQRLERELTEKEPHHDPRSHR